MLDAKNVVVLSGGLVADPESVANGKIIKFRLAVDYAAQEKDSDNRTGYFDVTYYANADNPNAKFVASQVDKGNFKKGSQLTVAGRLVQERWEGEKGKGQRVVVVAESMTYAGGNRTDGDNSAPRAAARSDEDAVALPDKF